MAGGCIGMVQLVTGGVRQVLNNCSSSGGGGSSSSGSSNTTTSMFYTASPLSSSSPLIIASLKDALASLNIQVQCPQIYNRKSVSFRAAQLLPLAGAGRGAQEGSVVFCIGHAPLPQWEIDYLQRGRGFVFYFVEGRGAGLWGRAAAWPRVEAVAVRADDDEVQCCKWRVTCVV